MAIDKFLGVGFKLTDSENFDEFMKELGVGMVTRKLANTISATVTLTEENGTYSLATNSTFKNTVITFKLGEEFDEETIDGRKVKTTITVEGNKIIQKQKGTPDTEIIRDYSDDTMVATMTVNNVVCKRTYTRV